MRESLLPASHAWVTSINGTGSPEARLRVTWFNADAGIPVTTIALDLGYSTASSFISLFRRTFGATPSAYRQRL